MVTPSFHLNSKVQKTSDVSSLFAGSCRPCRLKERRNIPDWEKSDSLPSWRIGQRELGSLGGVPAEDALGQSPIAGLAQEQTTRLSVRMQNYMNIKKSVSHCSQFY